MYKQFSNLNRSGRASGNQPESPGVRPFEAQAPKYSGMALFIAESGAMLDLDEIQSQVGTTIVYVLFCQNVPSTSLPILAITHIGVVLSTSTRNAMTSEPLPVVTIQFMPVLKPGQGPIESRPRCAMKIWNASVPPAGDLVSQEIFMRPAYDYFVSDEPSVQTKAGWSITLPTAATPSTGVAVRNVPLDNPAADQTDVYGTVVYAASAVSPDSRYPRPLSTILDYVEEQNGTFLAVADLTSPVAASQVESSTEHYWLSICKLSGQSATQWRFAKYGFDNELPVARLTNQRPLILLANDSVRFNP